MATKYKTSHLSLFYKRLTKNLHSRISIEFYKSPKDEVGVLKTKLKYNKRSFISNLP